MIIGIGNDIVHVQRIQAALARWGRHRFMKRIFTVEEIKECEASENGSKYISGRFAAKEAIFKAISPVHRLKWRDFSVTRSPSNSGQYLQVDWRCPFAHKALGGKVLISVSISHDGDYASAVAIASVT